MDAFYIEAEAGRFEVSADGDGATVLIHTFDNDPQAWRLNHERMASLRDYLSSSLGGDA